MNASRNPKSRSHDLAKRIRREIERGKWPAGSQLPGMRDLANQFDSSSSTIQSAIRLLEGEGLITCQARRGAFVRPEQPIAGSDIPIDRSTKSLPHIGLIGAARSNRSHGSDEWAIRIMRATEEELIDSNQYYLTRICSIEKGWKQNLENLAMRIDQLSAQLAGAVLFPGAAPQMLALMEQLDRLGLPWVSINHPTEQVIHNFVSTDNAAAGRTVGRCFLLNNFKKVLILSPDLKIALSWMQRVTGLIEAYLYEKRPIGGIEYLCGDGAEEIHGYDAMLSHLKTQRTLPEAIFATGDMLALGAIRALREKGIGVPEQVSVVGSADLSAAAFASVPLTVVSQPMEAMGRTAAQMLLRMIQTGERRLPGKQLLGRLVPRQSLKLDAAVRQQLIAEGLLDHPEPSPASTQTVKSPANAF